MTDRPRADTRYYKAHGLGNDYLVVEEGSGWPMDPGAVREVCHRHRGPGGDGIVVLLADAGDGVHRLRMFNPDGGEFERSGNGLRVLGSFLAREGRVEEGRPFPIEVGGDRVIMTVHGHSGADYDVSVDMGRALTGAQAVAMDPAALADDRTMAGPDGPLDLVAVSVGNPHLVVWGQDMTDERLAVVGPFLTGHEALANGTNVQLARLADDGACDALIWERGVGPTTASGTSSCAVAVASVVRGHQEPGTIRIRMVGGDLLVDVSPDLDVVLRGPVREVMDGRLADGFVSMLRDGAFA